jgi:hypothetical protein
MDSEEQFVQASQIQIQKIVYWLGEDHPYLCDVYDILVDFNYCYKLKYREAFRLMSECLRISCKMCGNQTGPTARIHHKLGAM